MEKTRTLIDVKPVVLTVVNGTKVVTVNLAVYVKLHLEVVVDIDELCSRSHKVRVEVYCSVLVVG